jgi:hypothetical protein
MRRLFAPNRSGVPLRRGVLSIIDVTTIISAIFRQVLRRFMDRAFIDRRGTESEATPFDRIPERMDADERRRERRERQAQA